MKVATILRAKGSHVHTTRPDTTVYSVVWEFRLRGVGALVVTEDGVSVLGLVSERDVVRALTEHGAGVLSLPVSRVMTTPVHLASPEDGIAAVMERMTRHRVRHLPVVEQGRLCGIVSLGDLVKHRLDELEMEANILRETLIAGR
jgi:CBS domain-containing protein